MFAEIAANGMDPSKPLKWGFFFVAAKRKPLDAILSELDGHGYTTESLGKMDDGTWALQVSKTEVLPADKLHRRNLAFNDLAAGCGADGYDGWDVGLPDD